MNPLTPNELRVLGSLIEKDITTPDYYPMSLNALVNACNQKNNREPVTSLDESAVREALDGLQNQGLAGPAHGAEGRVAKFEHRAYEKLNLGRREIAILCVLLLRGPQTPGELRGRTERLYNFEDLADVQATLNRLIEREPPMVKILPRQPGTKEARYIHLLAGDAEPEITANVWHTRETQPAAHVGTEELEAEVARLKQEVAELRQQFAEFKRQFEG